MKVRALLYSDAELAWIEARKQMPRRELHLAFCAEFKRHDVTLNNIRNLCKRNRWMTGRTGCFAAGHIPANKDKKMPFNANSAQTRFKKGNRSGVAKMLYKPIGTERLSRDGYWERKINDGMPLQSRWRAVHLINWEQINGSIRDGHCLKSLDGDRTNTDPANWIEIPRALLPRINGRWTGLSYDDAEPELKSTILATAKVQHAAREKRKR